MQSPTFAQPIVANMPAILSGTVLMSPALPRISSNLPVTNAVLAAKAAQAASAGTVAPPPSISDLLDLEHDLYLDPVGTLRRHFKVYVLPLVVGAGGAILGEPQRDCVPVRLCIPSGSAAGKTLGALASGVDQYFATRDNVPASMFAVGNGGGGQSSEQSYLRPIVTQVGKNIEASSTLTAGTAVGMFCFDLSESGVLTPPYGRPMHMGSKQTIVHGAAAVDIDLFPLKGFRIRRLGINVSVANWNDTIDATHGISIGGIFVGNEPQTEDNGFLPADMFNCQGEGGWIDGDFAKVGKKVTINVVNNEAANDIVLEFDWFGDTLDD